MLIYEQIDEYAGYMYTKHPLKAGAHRALLTRLGKEMHLRSAKDINENIIAFFVGEQLTGYYSSEAIKAIRAFLRFCERAGYNVIDYRFITELNMRKKTGPKPNIEIISDVQRMRSEKKSYNKIVTELAGKYDRPIHRYSVIRWAQYILP